MKTRLIAALITVAISSGCSTLNVIESEKADAEKRFRGLIDGADQIVIKWREDFPVQEFGLTRIKARYRSRAEIEAFASSIVFEKEPAPMATKLEFTEKDIEEGNVVMPMTWCSHVEHYTHRIEFSKAGIIVGELKLAVDGRPQAIILSDGQRAWVSDESVNQLRNITNADREYEIVREILEKQEKERANQAPEPTAPSGRGSP
jgi:hypothetical protein